MWGPGFEQSGRGDQYKFKQVAKETSIFGSENMWIHLILYVHFYCQLHFQYVCITKYNCTYGSYAHILNLEVALQNKNVNNKHLGY